jgi:hypothetical protein
VKDLIALLYLSTAGDKLDEKDMSEILVASRKKTKKKELPEYFAQEEIILFKYWKARRKRYSKDISSYLMTTDTKTRC